VGVPVGVVIQAVAAAAVVTLLEAVLLQVAVILLQAAVIHQQVAVILYRTVEAIRLEAAATPCRQRSQVAVGSEVHLYRRVKRDMTSALRQILLI
jgi:hypothetical protein